MVEKLSDGKHPKLMSVTQHLQAVESFYKFMLLSGSNSNIFHSHNYSKKENLKKTSVRSTFKETKIQKQNILKKKTLREHVSHEKRNYP